MITMSFTTSQRKRSEGATAYLDIESEEHQPPSKVILQKRSKFKISNFEKYNGTIDPQKNIASYYVAMCLQQAMDEVMFLAFSMPPIEGARNW